MIRVNLLPLDRRRPEKTPLPRFLLVVLAAALTTCVLVAVAFTFVQMMNVNKDIDQLKTEEANLTASVNEYERVNKIVEAVVQKDDMIQKLEKRTVVWSDVLDDVWTVLDAEKSLYILDISMLDENQARGFILGPGGRPLPKGQAPPFGLKIEVRIFSLDTTRLTALRAALSKHEDIAKVLPLMNPKPTIVYSTSGTFPQMEFTLVLLAKPGPTP